MAVVKRAYRKQPQNGFCPSPEPAWAEFTWAHMTKLEELLRFFHASCKHLLENLPMHLRFLLMGNIDVAAVEAFWITRTIQEGRSAEA